MNLKEISDRMTSHHSYSYGYVPFSRFFIFFYNSKIQTIYYTFHVLSWTLGQITLTSTQPYRMLSSNTIESIVQTNPWYNDCILFWEGKKNVGQQTVTLFFILFKKYSLTTVGIWYSSFKYNRFVVLFCLSLHLRDSKRLLKIMRVCLIKVRC